MRIYVQNEGVDDLKPLDVEPTDTMRSLKAAMIQDMLFFRDEEMEQRMVAIEPRDMVADVGCPSTLVDCRDLLLLDDGHGTTTLDGCKEGTKLNLGFKEPVRDCFSVNHSTSPSPPDHHDDDDDDDDLDKVDQLQLVIEFPNMPWRFPLMCSPTDTISTVRKGIISEHDVHDQLFGQTYIDKGQFVIFFGTSQLKDESATLEEHGIKHMDAVQVFEDAWLPIVLISTSPDRIEPQIRVDMKCFDTVGALKGKLREEKRRLVYKGWYLDDEERRLVDYGIAKPVEYDPSVASRGYENGPFWVDRPDGGEFLVCILASSDDPAEPSTVQITFEIPNTPCRFPLTFKPSDTIGAVREGVIEEFRRRGGPLDRSYIEEGAFVLVRGAKQLRKESATLDQCGIRHMDSVQIFEEASFGIDIFTPELHTVVEVSCFDTVGTLKKKLQVATGIPKKQQHLEYCEVYVEWYLDDHKRRLVDFGISKQVEWDGEVFPQDARIHVNHSTSSPPDHQDDDDQLQIVIEFPNMPWRFPLMCSPTDTISTMRKGIITEHDLHDQLIGQTYIGKGLFVLVFGTSQLKDESITLEERGIKHMDTVQVFEDAWIPIVISTASDCIESLIRVDMKCFDKVATLKGKIRDATGVPEEKQRLVYKGWCLDDEERSLVDYGIAKQVEYDQSVAFKGYENSPFWVDRSDGDFLVILASSDDPAEPNTVQITFKIPNTPGRFPLTFKPSDTIGVVREGVIEECRRRGGLLDRSYIEEGEFVLVCGAKQLRKESTTLDQCGIRHMDSVQIFEKASFGIDIYTPDLHTVVEVSCFDTVGMLKKKLQVATGIPKKKQHLKYCEVYVDWYLDDDKRRLVDFGISKQVEWDGERFPQDARILVASAKNGLHHVSYI